MSLDTKATPSPLRLLKGIQGGGRCREVLAPLGLLGRISAQKLMWDLKAQSPVPSSGPGYRVEPNIRLYGGIGKHPRQDSRRPNQRKCQENPGHAHPEKGIHGLCRYTLEIKYIGLRYNASEIVRHSPFRFHWLLRIFSYEQSRPRSSIGGSLYSARHLI